MLRGWLELGVNGQTMGHCRGSSRSWGEPRSRAPGEEVGGATDGAATISAAHGDRNPSPRASFLASSAGSFGRWGELGTSVWIRRGGLPESLKYQGRVSQRDGRRAAATCHSAEAMAHHLRLGSGSDGQSGRVAPCSCSPWKVSAGIGRVPPGVAGGLISGS